MSASDSSSDDEGDPTDWRCHCCVYTQQPAPALPDDAPCDCECHSVEPVVRSRLAERGIAVGPAAFEEFLARGAAPVSWRGGAGTSSIFDPRERQRATARGAMTMPDDDECRCCCLGLPVCGCACACACHDKGQYSEYELQDQDALAPQLADCKGPGRLAVVAEALEPSDLEPGASLALVPWVVRPDEHEHPLQLCRDPYSYRVAAPPQAPQQGGWTWRVCWQCDLCEAEGMTSVVYHCAACGFDACPLCVL